ncbi:MAG: hypothetical protein K2O04_06360 [Clostridiales bacterium]|nr:hypothetical protein [Clostridiales bacterium]
MTLWRRIIALVASIAVAVLAWLAFSFVFGNSAQAEEPEQDDVAVQADTQPAHDEVFGVDHANATKLSVAADFNTLPSGTYCLDADIVLTSTKSFYYSEDIKLCLHGHSVSISGRDIFGIYGGAVFNVYDCGEDSMGAINVGTGINVVNGGVFNLYGGAVKGGNGVSAGVSIWGMNDSPVFNMYGGVISDHSATNNGGGVHIGNKGIFNMYGGTITNNTTKYSSGGAGVLVADASGAFHMYGGNITSNFVDYSNAPNEQSKVVNYHGAGVYVNGGEFTLEGDVNISGNVRGDATTKTANNLELFRSDNYPGKIKITGKLGENAKIGVTMPTGVLTEDYTAKGNTEDPSKYFVYDGGVSSGLSVGFDARGQEAAVSNGEVGSYEVTRVKVVGAPGATVGDTQVTFTVEVTLTNTSDPNDVIIENDTATAEFDSPLHGGNNPVTFDYKYGNETQARQLSYVVVPAKLHVRVTWGCTGATLEDRNAATREYDGTDIFSGISATYTGYDGEEKSAEGSWTSNAIIATDENGNAVNSIAGVGVYKFHLATSVDYEFDNNLFTLTVVGSIDDGYYQMDSARVIGVKGTPAAGDKNVTIIVERKLKHTKDQPDATDRVDYLLTLSTALHVGENSVTFDYKYNDKGGDVQTESLTVTVTATKKTVTIKWYFNGSVVANNATQHVFDGVDAAGKIVAEYDGIDGTKQRVDGTSAAMLKKDKDGNAVSALSAVGEYTLTLADSADYVFKNNSFRYTVAEKLSDIMGLTYEENGVTVLGVSRADGFEAGTELVVERVTDYNPNVVAGEIKSALDVKFVKNSGEVTPTGTLTVRVLIPEELRGKAYKLYNLAGNVPYIRQYSTDGNYVVFETDALNCILFVDDNSAPPIVDPPVDPPIVDPPVIDPPVDDPPIDNPPDHNNADDPFMSANIDDAGLAWLWVVLAILGAVAVIAVVALVCKAKSKKK